MELARIARLSLVAGLLWLGQGQVAAAAEGWTVGDWHMHTKMSDGSQPLPAVFDQALAYGLDWFGSSDHGGGGIYDPFAVLWIDRPDVLILGDSFENNRGIQGMWRWQALSQYAHPVVESYRVDHPGRVIWQGFEWSAPAANDATVAILADDRVAISDFEYMFCRYDDDTSRADEGLVKQNETWEDALAAAAWLERHHPETGFISINHPSRSLDWSPGEIRDLHNAGPHVMVGLEGIPGHQKSEYRGSYGNTVVLRKDLDVTYKARTYGGADFMLAKLGGLWDSLLGEGRRLFVAANSDFHRESEDFWPGEYAKTHVHSADLGNPAALVAGIKSGRSFIVTGDLVDALEVEALSGDRRATMGATLRVRSGEPVLVRVRFRSPELNNAGDAVAVDHLDIITGRVTGPLVPGTSAYKHGEENPSTAVAARFSAWDTDEEGYGVVSYVIPAATESMYLRVRGTNLGLGVPDQTDADGNPLRDDLLGANDEEKAWADLWFYSNPIFIEVEP